MADSWDDTTPEPRDPVLVRPYITTEPAAPETSGHDDRPDETWPHTAMLPDEPAAGATSELPRVAAGPSAGKGAALFRQRLLVLSGVVVLALAAAGVLWLTTGDDPSQDVGSPINPSYATPTANASLGAGVSATRSPAASAAPSQGGARASVTTTERARASQDPANPPVSAAPPQGQAPAAPTDGTTTTTPTDPAVAPTATLNPPPAADRTGPVTAASGRCLALGTLLGLDGSAIQTSGCSGVSYQSFTLATDGTLRVAGHCTEATAAGELRTTTCGDSETAQWRTGPANTLVNPASGLCLTDPGTSGATVRVATCDGSPAQTWTLP